MHLFTNFIISIIFTFLIDINDAKDSKLKESHNQLEVGNINGKNDQRQLMNEFCELHHKKIKSKQLKNCCKKLNKLNRKENLKSNENADKIGGKFPKKILQIYNELIEHKNGPKQNLPMPKQCRKVECPNAEQCHLFKKKEKKGKKKKAKHLKKEEE